ncbi:probable (S)-N-methylcoclaurine 3'-hydroxylase isozyme 2 [Coffea arabica]|uniref:Probable (S)-N-methylcoclaurine 3'-hydroxylase isozyme 2 n=1 Tax=Coffea arabica TaxID=13443 RepID=A0A6P6SQ27_COFAR|nr:probable (S)-N-methylcoclaurine 3'-hydroxylase isozyme 2 [Coffea arabica]
MDITGLDGAYYNYFLFSLVLLSPILLLVFTQRKTRLPPGPFAWPVIGNLFDLDGKKPHIALSRLAQSYGPLISLRFGARLVVVASSPEAAREIFMTHNRDLSGRHVVQLAKILPQIDTSMIAMAAECNERWRFLRSTAHSELFSAQALESFSQIRLDKAKEMLDFLASKDGEVVKISDILLATSANIMSNAMVSQDIVSWKNIGEVRRCIRRLLEFGIPGLADLFPAIGCLDFWTKQKAVECTRILRETWIDIVSKRRGGRADVAFCSRDFLDVLVENSFDDYQIYNLLTEFLISSETISTAIEWAMAELTRNQEASSKLLDELMKYEIEGTALSEKHLTQLPYLQACIKETLRLHPPTPLLVPRRASQTCEFMNYNLPKDSLVVVNAYALGRDEKSWEDPQGFKPERFLGTSLDVKGTHYELLPFGGGRRICAGYPLALKQIQLLLASLVYAFDWLHPPGMEPTNLDMSEKFGFTLARENPLLLIPRIRNDMQKDWAEALGLKKF